MDDATLSRLVDDLIQSGGEPQGAFQAHQASDDHDEREHNIHRQYLMASLRRGYFSTEPVAVDVSGRLDVEYGNPGPEISVQQQMTSTGLLSAVNSEEISTTKKQERYRMLSLFPSEMFGNDGPLGEELKALEEDDDVHSVSVISAVHDDDAARYKHCSIDCWLKTSERAENSGVPTLSLSQGPHQGEPFATYQPYTYGKLDKMQTRLLNVLPGKFGDPIICELTTVTIASQESGNGPSLDAQLKYDALSYTWGDPSPILPIEFGGKVLLIPRNAFSALQHLRHETAHSTLWIDAICINQEDKTERSEQVVQMHQIYKSAARVIVWLGEGFEDSHLAMMSMKYLDEKKQREGVTQRIHDQPCYDRLKRLCKAQDTLFESLWFRRSWIRQEVMVAKHITVVCGHDTIQWYAMKRSAARLERLYSKMVKENVLSVTEFHDDKSTAIECLTRGWIYGQPVTKLIGCIRSIWYYHCGGLLDLLMASREYEATDARDKVYSVLGLARVSMTTRTDSTASDSRTTAFPVDYTKSVSEVYQDVVKYFVNQNRNLDILSILLTHRNDTSDDDLPSWVPDWRIPVSEIPITAHWDFVSLKVAAGGFRVEALSQIHEEIGILRVQGHIFDAIHHFDNYLASVHHVLCTWPEFDDDENGEVNRHRQRGERAMYAEAFDSGKHRTKCCVTADNGICLAPARAREGDHIAIFLGAKHPFVIRPINPGPHPQEGAGAAIQAKVVGPCIVPHAMFGKLVKLAKEQDIAPTEFTLV